MSTIKLYNFLKQRKSDPACLWLFRICYLANQFEFAAPSCYSLVDYSYFAPLKVFNRLGP